MRQDLKKNLILIIALVIGFFIGYGISNVQMKKEKKYLQERIEEAGRRIVFFAAKDYRCKNICR
jgi:uncharacterized protein YneF (UPF0154 family)